MKHTQPFCKIPFSVAYTTQSKVDSFYRDCCVKNPKIFSKDQSFSNWWQSGELNNFRNRLLINSSWPASCENCKINEENGNQSLRLSAEKEFAYVPGAWPQSWHIQFGNLCNLGCWTCGEEASTVIRQHKIKAGIPLSRDDDIQAEFQRNWPELKENIIMSYNYHSVVKITFVGGEPFYNPTVIEFLKDLVKLGLAKRTKIELTTNGTVSAENLPLEKGTWKYVSILVSVDAIGKYAEWLRYGCVWNKVSQNIQNLQNHADYTELQTVVSVLNINCLGDLYQYANTMGLPLYVSLVESPDFMSLRHWDLSKEELLIDPDYTQFSTYYDLIGSSPKIGSSERLKNYINSFAGVRAPLHHYNDIFANKLNLNA